MMLQAKSSARLAVLCALLSSLTVSPQVAHAEAPAVDIAPALQPQDFAYGYELPTHNAQVHELELPASVYAGLTRADRRDLCVFDGQGQVVPFTIFLPPEQEPQIVSLEVPWFALPGNDTATQDDLSLYVRRDERGTIAEVRAPRPTSSITQGTRAWLADLTGTNAPILSIAPIWKETAADFLAEVEISASDDLTTWSHVSTAPVAQLRAGQKRLGSTPLTLGSRTTQYLRLTLKGKTPNDLDLIGLSLSVAQRQKQTKPASLILASRPGESPLTFLFSVPGPIPAARAQVTFAESNTLVEGVLEAAPTRTDSFTERFRGAFYFLQGNEGDRSIALQDGDRWLRLTLLDKGSARTARPSLRVAYQPHHLQFLPRGAAPHLLAVGSARRVAEPVSGVLPVRFDVERVERVVLGTSRRALGGEAMLKPAAPVLPPPPFRTYGLWAVLVLTTALFAWLAMRLVRDMKPK